MRRARAGAAGAALVAAVLVGGAWAEPARLAGGPAPSAACALGTWTGTVRQPGFAPYPVVLTIREGAHGPLAEARYPTIPCAEAGRRLSGHQAGPVAFRARVIWRRDLCVDGVIGVACRPDGQLDWRWVGDDGVDELKSVLSRTDPR